LRPYIKPQPHISLRANPFPDINNPRKRKASPNLAERMTKMIWVDVKALFSAKRDHLDESLEAQGEMFQADIRALKRNAHALERKLRDDIAAEQTKRTVLDFMVQQSMSSKELAAHFDLLVSRLDSFSTTNASVKAELASISAGHASITERLDNMGVEIGGNESSFTSSAQLWMQSCRRYPDSWRYCKLQPLQSIRHPRLGIMSTWQPIARHRPTGARLGMRGSSRGQHISARLVISMIELAQTRRRLK
jgi:hypothetical protein